MGSDALRCSNNNQVCSPVCVARLIVTLEQMYHIFCFPLILESVADSAFMPFHNIIIKTNRWLLSIHSDTLLNGAVCCSLHHSSSEWSLQAYISVIDGDQNLTISDNEALVHPRGNKLADH